MTYTMPNGRVANQVCLACKNEQHDECSYGFALALDDQACCCGGQYSLDGEMAAILQEQIGTIVTGTAPAKPKLQLKGEPDEQPASTRKPPGNPGYIDPRAWASTRDIGTLSEPTSTGRKRAKDMYPTPIGHVCEWAGLAAAGGGVEPIVGCLGSPATDLHHGPDKNTLNNARVSDGTSDWEQNVHLICSRCHNAWHGANNKYYEPRDHAQRIAKQATPWVPTVEYKQHDGETQADRETLYRVDKERDEREKEDDRRKRNRSDRTFTGGRRDLTDDELDGDTEPDDNDERASDDDTGE